MKPNKKLLLIGFALLLVIVFSLWSQQSGLIKGDIISNCVGVDDLLTCRQRFAVKVLNKLGPDAALEQVAKLSKTDPVFASECHAFAHSLGEASYPLYLEGKQVLPAQPRECDWGFYHGFIMELASHGQDLAVVDSLCRDLTEDIGVDSKAVRQCYHGVGHGLPLRFAPDYWQQVDEVLSQSLNACREQFKNHPECARGVFGGMGTLFSGIHNLKFDIEADKLFSICTRQPDDLQQYCYEQLVPGLMVLVDNDLTQAIVIAKNIDSKHQGQVAQSLGGFILTSIPGADISQAVSVCRELKPFSADCIQGYIMAQVYTKPITDFETDILAECRSNLLLKMEQDQCHEGALMQFEDTFGGKQ